MRLVWRYRIEPAIRKSQFGCCHCQDVDTRISAPHGSILFDRLRSLSSNCIANVVPGPFKQHPEKKKKLQANLAHEIRNFLFETSPDGRLSYVTLQVQIID